MPQCKEKFQKLRPFVIGAANTALIYSMYVSNSLISTEVAVVTDEKKVVTTGMITQLSAYPLLICRLMRRLRKKHPPTKHGRISA